MLVGGAWTLDSLMNYWRMLVNAISLHEILKSTLKYYEQKNMGNNFLCLGGGGWGVIRGTKGGGVLETLDFNQIFMDETR